MGYITYWGPAKKIILHYNGEELDSSEATALAADLLCLAALAGARDRSGVLLERLTQYRDRLTGVLEAVATAAGDLMCPVCGKVVTNHGNMKRHMTTHPEYQPDPSP